MFPIHESLESAGAREISSDMVKDAETFDTLWYSQIRDYINKELIVAHNAPFDIGVLRATLSHYDLEMPDFRYMCSCQLSRRVWREFPRHSLGELCGRMGIGFNHHRAGDDAEACAKVVIKASERIEVAKIIRLYKWSNMFHNLYRLSHNSFAIFHSKKRLPGKD